MDKDDVFNLRPNPGEGRVSVYFRKQTKEGGFILRCKGGKSAVNRLVRLLNDIDFVKEDED